MNLTAEQIQNNWEVFLGLIEEHISSPRKEKLLEFYNQYITEVEKLSKHSNTSKHSLH